MAEAIRNALGELRERQSERLIRLREVMKLTGLSRSAVYAAVKAGSLPPPIQILPGGRATAWVESEILWWVHDRVASARSSVQTMDAKA